MPDRGRPRSAEADAAIQAAALELLSERGFSGLTMEALAERAGVSKPTLYRRFHAPAEVAMSVVAALDADAVPLPDTGSLRDDLLAVAIGMVRLLEHSPFGEIVPALVGAGQVHPELREAATRYVARRRALVEELIVRGVDRGELPAGTDAPFVLDLLLAPFYFRHLITHDPVDDGFAARVCDATLAAAGWRPRAD